MDRAGGAQAQNAAFISRNRGFGDPACCGLRFDTTPETPRERMSQKHRDGRAAGMDLRPVDALGDQDRWHAFGPVKIAVR